MSAVIDMSAPWQLSVACYGLSNGSFCVRAITEAGQVFIEAIMDDEYEAVARVLDLIKERGWVAVDPILHLPYVKPQERGS